ncbi:nucleotidyltransferase domain-containing protein [Actinoplanes sp. NBC_00393]|uniref:nucleotidyltransferase domain-containing protein n=1 Tax=Actinoplanes sp. NBC_00393 TaxID=2975953 RepID=UPI002E1C475E
MAKGAKPVSAAAGVIARLAAKQFGAPAAEITAKGAAAGAGRSAARQGASVVSGIPKGFTERQFARFARGARQLQRHAGLPDGELVVHGSRVRGTAHPKSDIDVALRVNDRTFFELSEKALARARPGTKLRNSMLRRINGNGQLSSFDLGPEFQRLRHDLLDPESPHPVQFSVLRKGGKLDTGPFRPLA